NLVNLLETGIPTSWSVQPEKNIKWAVNLGSKAYGGPVIHRGKIFVGTNNQVPRNAAKEYLGDKGIVMCFSESNRKFLLQLVHDKLPAGRVNDWPLEGICSSACAEGERIYYVNNRAEVVCATTEGLGGGKNEGVQNETYKSKIDGDIVW